MNPPPAWLDTIEIVSEDAYAERGYPHEAWARLRREAPVCWWERGVKKPFWAITKHADVIEIAKHPRRFVNAPRLAVFPEFEPPTEDERVARHLLNMDPPEHVRFRQLISGRFTPRAIARLEPQVDAIAAEIAAELGEPGEERDADFVEAFAARLPLAVLADLLGVPREDWRPLFRWTNQTIGAGDPEYQEGDIQTTAEKARTALFEYFWKMVEERRREPREDIVSALANAELDGAPVPPFELLSYLFLLVVAGNETTRNATSGGMLAFAERPGEWRRLRERPELLEPAVEEIVRWTSPVIQFCRTATEDTEIRGQRIRRGDSLCLFYPSANRDEEVFADPFEFRIDRSPNPHLAFGVGEHFCLGAHLARLELRAAFRQLAGRLDDFELTGPPSRLRSSFVGGVKHVPLRYRLAPAG